MSLILHVSDTHFGTEQPPVVEALLALAHQQRPDVAVLSGDITQRARHSEFAAAKAFIERLPVPARVLLPGNHDISLLNPWRRLVTPHRHFLRMLSDVLEPEFENADLLIVGVNTTRRFRHVDGCVSLQQIQRVSERLRHAPAAKLKLVVTHQPVHVMRERDAHNLLHGRAAAMRAWSQAGAHLILGGHIHLPFVQPLREAHGLPREVWAVQAGTAVSSRVRPGGPNSVNLIRHSPDRARCVVERWDYADGQFACHSGTDIVLDHLPAA